MNFCHLTLFVLLVQVTRGLTENQEECEPGFRETRYAFSVTRKVLERSRILGKVSFNSCSRGSRTLYSPDDTRFRVLSDGTVSVKRQITLHDGSVSFVIHAWDSEGRKHSVPVFIWNQRDQQVTA
ncbi:cadherin-1-like [Rhinophrynus dorsalis]